MALANLIRGRTTFVIAHRLATILHADRILVIDRGRIVQQGSHADLHKQTDIFRQPYEPCLAAVAPLPMAGGTW